jgi:hypothetical protein
MNTHSAKAASRASKAVRRSDKKCVENDRTTAKKASKSARSSSRAASTAIRAPSFAPKSAPNLAEMIRTALPPVQLATGAEIPMMAHKYRVGETVYYTSPSFGRAAASGSYTVVKLLPSEGDDYQYRIKSSGEAFERVAKESQLDRI